MKKSASDTLNSPNTRDTHTSAPKKYLQAKFVEEEVDEVLDAGQDAMIQVLSRDALEDDAEGRGLQVVVETEVELVPMDCRLEHQQPQQHQMVLQRRAHVKRKADLGHNGSRYVFF